jgi:hypothetical protein
MPEKQKTPATYHPLDDIDGSLAEIRKYLAGRDKPY